MAAPAFAETSSNRPLPRLRYRSFGDLRIHVAVGDENILPPVIVEIEKVHPEPDEFTIDAEAGPDAGVLEGAPEIPVQRRDLFGEVGPDDIQLTVRVEITYTHAHPRKGDAMLIERDARRHCHFPKSAIVVIAIQQARRRVARHIDIRPPVVVEIGRSGSHSVRAGRLPVATDEDHGRWSARASDAGLFRDVDERPVPAVAVQDVRAACETLWPARHRNLVVAAVP